ncbi:MAG: preprotein translocase subunit SecD [Haloferacaceae archaeon]
MLVLLASGFSLFSPTVAGEAVEDRPTNLRYGIELNGGTRILAPLEGVTAEGVQFEGDDAATVRQAVAAEIPEADVTDVIVRGADAGNATGTVELTTDAPPERLANALDAAGYDYETVRTGVTAQTVETTVSVLQSKINEAGLSGGTVRPVQTSQGRFVLVEVPGEERGDVLRLIRERGEVTVQSYHPVQRNGSQVYVNTTVLTSDDFQSVGAAATSQRTGQAYVPVTVRESEAPRVQRVLVETGVASGPGNTRCTYRSDPQNTEPCLLLVVDGEVVNSFGMDAGLKRSMQSGQWATDPAFRLTTTNITEAQQIAVDLRAGALPARLNVSAGTVESVSPSAGARFKLDAVITGIVAMFAVAFVVFLRYGEPKVAAPMVVTALSEVFVLLGLAAAIGYPLDLSVIAGFIAVIGTGVDDLIIIADEVMAQGEVSSRRVFRSRFRKAFWVIGVAAGTTIIAMAPLAVLPSLGSLKGFAIFTILGVLVGVLLTRPAYGDILRALLTNR